ncbi:MAG: hypothetical protein ACYCY9_09450 [Thiobacillus sp.]
MDSKQEQRFFDHVRAEWRIIFLYERDMGSPDIWQSAAIVRLINGVSSARPFWSLVSATARRQLQTGHARLVRRCCGEGEFRYSVNPDQTPTWRMKNAGSQSPIRVNFRCHDLLTERHPVRRIDHNLAVSRREEGRLQAFFSPV